MAFVMFERNEKFRKIEKLIFYMIIFLLGSIMMCGMCMGLAAIALVRCYGENAIFQSRLIFKVRDQESLGIRGASLLPSFITTTASKHNFTLNDNLAESNGTMDDDVKEIYSILAKDERGLENERRLYIRKPMTIPSEIGGYNASHFTITDLIFLTTMTVDTVHSEWGPLGLRNYIVYYPFVMEMTALVWGTILIVFRTGKDKQWGLSQPWMIVVPSIFFFAVMSICTMIYWVIVSKAWYGFCDNLRSHLTNKNDTINCILLIHALQPTPYPMWFGFEFQMKVFLYADDLALVMWMICLLIMTMRCVFVVDFQLVYVTVSVKHSTKDNHKGSPSSYNISKERDGIVTVKFEDPQQSLKALSKERGSEDDFHSAHSTLTTFTTNEDEQSSQPLVSSNYSYTAV